MTRLIKTIYDLYKNASHKSCMYDILYVMVERNQSAAALCRTTYRTDDIAAK